MHYGEDIELYRSHKTMRAIRANQQHVVQTHNPSSIQPGQVASALSNIGPDDIIISGSFFISGAPKRTVVPDIGRKIIKTLKVYFESNEVLSIKITTKL